MKLGLGKQFDKSKTKEEMQKEKDKSNIDKLVSCLKFTMSYTKDLDAVKECKVQKCKHVEVVIKEKDALEQMVEYNISKYQKQVEDELRSWFEAKNVRLDILRSTTKISEFRICITF